VQTVTVTVVLLEASMIMAISMPIQLTVVTVLIQRTVVTMLIQLTVVAVATVQDPAHGTVSIPHLLPIRGHLVAVKYLEEVLLLLNDRGDRPLQGDSRTFRGINDHDGQYAVDRGDRGRPSFS
jgi:hypothetical protein